MATKGQINHLMHGVGGTALGLRAPRPQPSLSMGKEALHDHDSKQKSKPPFNPFAFAGQPRAPAHQRTVAPVRSSQLAGTKRKRGLTNITVPTEPSHKKPRTSVALTSTAGGSNVDSGLEGLLLGQHTASTAAKTSKPSPSTTDVRLENLLEGRKPSRGRHSGTSSDTDEIALCPRTAGKQRDEAEGSDDGIIDLGKPKPSPRGRALSKSTLFKSVDDRVRQFEQRAAEQFPYRDQRAQPPRPKKISNMRGKTLSNITALKTQPQPKDYSCVLTSIPASKVNNVRKPTPHQNSGEEIIIESCMPVELWYLGVERKMPGFEVEDTRASLQWEATGEARKLIVTIETNKRSETFQIDINDLELWANIKEGRGALFVLKTTSPFYRQHKQRGSFVEGGDLYGRAMLFRFSSREWEREKESLEAFLTKLKEHNAYGKKPMKEFEDSFKIRANEARQRKPESPPPLGSHTPEPSTSTLADMESLPPPPAHLSPRKMHTREQVITTSRSTRSAAQRENTARQKELEEVILAYPFTGAGGVEITKGDLNRLEPGEFLNDTLVEFSLKRWLHELKETNAELADDIHVFSTFFYKRLKTGTPQQGYANVRKWTSKVDIFKKKYLIVPINEHLHWYLAIILFPGNAIASAHRSGQYYKADAATVSSHSPEFVPETPTVGSPATSNVLLPPESDLGPESADEMELPKHRRRLSINIDDKPVEVPMRPMENKGPVEENLTPRASLQESNRDSMEPIDSVMKDAKNSQSLDPMNQTWILTFDSLGGRHQAAISALNAYLKAEALDKKGVDLGNKPPVHGKKVPTPEQPNSCDCGVYVGQVVETIFESPAEFWQLAFSRVQKNRLTRNHSLWDIERFKEKRAELCNLVTKLSEQWKEVRSKTTPASLPNSSTPPVSETAAKEDQHTPPLTPGKRKARSAEPMEVPEEDDDVVILDVPAAKRQQRSPHKNARSTPRKSAGNAALRLKKPGR